MLAEMQSAMNNMVNNQLQNEFQLASLKSDPLMLSPRSSTSSTFPSVPVAPKFQPQAVPEAHSPFLPAPACPPTQSPLRMNTSPPPCQSPGIERTIAAITRAHRETFVYAHDQLDSSLKPQFGADLAGHSANNFLNNYHVNGPDFFHQASVPLQHNGLKATPDDGQSSPVPIGQNVNNSNWYGVQINQCNQYTNNLPVQNCPWKNQKEILLVSKTILSYVQLRWLIK